MQRVLPTSHKLPLSVVRLSQTRCLTEVATGAHVAELVVDTQMGMTVVPAAISADTQALETILHPIPTGMITLGLEKHESSWFLESSRS